jgi:uncharacterized protein (DUF362 family)
LARIDEQAVVVCSAAEAAYPAEPPFDPPNHVHDAVRACFSRAGLDSDRQGTPEWNPLGELIRPGETVLLKPNFVKESHPRDPDGWRYVLTHGSVIRAVADHVFAAVGREGRVVIADAPQTDSSFDAIVRVLGLDRVQAHYRERDFELELIDLRREEWLNRGGVIVGRTPLAGDPRGGVPFDLGTDSELTAHGGAGRYYGAFYDAGEVNSHHSGGRHEYLVSASAIEADVIFSLPKLKTHKKAGITVSLKNLVGLNADKNWLPHHTEGNPANGGDEYPEPSATHRLERMLARAFRQLTLRVPGFGPWLHRQARPVGLSLFGDTETVVRSGNWWGNDTTWRMCLDLNKLVLYGNPDGTMRAAGRERRKRHFVLVDGIVAGESRGPLNPDPVEAGLVVFGLHPASVDAACAVLMGFDPERIPIVRGAFSCERYPLVEWGWRDVRVVAERPEWSRPLPEIDPRSTLRFEPHFGWKGKIEREAPPAAGAA